MCRQTDNVVGANKTMESREACMRNQDAEKKEFPKLAHKLPQESKQLRENSEIGKTSAGFVKQTRFVMRL